MLKNSDINLIMDKLYGEDDQNLDLCISDQHELDELQEQLKLLDQWDIDGEDTNLQTPTIDENDILNLKELAKYLQLSEEEIILLLPEIPHVNLAGKYRFQLESIKQWLSSVEKNKVVYKKKSEVKNNIVNFQDFLVRNVI